MSRSLLKCPNCGLGLEKDINTYKCANGHCFDIASSSYLNLIMANKKKKLNSGDNKIMVNARKEFLNKGYYSNLVTAVLDEIEKDKRLNYLDIGCGEGYFTNGFKNLNSKLNAYAFDVSKEAIKKASKLNDKIVWLVANINNIPLKDHSIDVITQLFAPHNVNEYIRLLKDDGILITVTPAKKHLYEIKELLYDEVYLNSEKIIEDKRLKLIKDKEVTRVISITNNEDITNLLKMTPYYYRTKQSAIEKLLNLQNLNVTTSFSVRVYKKTI